MRLLLGPQTQAPPLKKGTIRAPPSTLLGCEIGGPGFLIADVWWGARGVTLEDGKDIASIMASSMRDCSVHIGHPWGQHFCSVIFLSYLTFGP